MAIVTTNRRLNKISDEHETIERNWARLASDLQRETDLLKQFAAWRNEMFLSGSGDLDLEDMQTFRNSFDGLYGSITRNFEILKELNDMPASTPEEFKESNDAFIARHNISVLEFDKRFK